MSKFDIVEEKIIDRSHLQSRINVWRLLEKKIVFTNGCFDLLHRGHADYLIKAAELGDRLIVGLNSDLSASNLKGAGRPITDQSSRALLLASFSFVDAVILFDEQDPLDLITWIKPDVLVKGADYSIDQIVGADVVLNNGGHVQTLEYLPGYSTSLIEQKIRSGKA